MILPKSFFDTTNYFGISLDAASIKAVSVLANGQIASYSRLPLVDFDLNQPQSDSKVLAQALKKLKSEGKFASPYVAMVIPESQVFSKRFFLPHVSLSEFTEAVKWQLGDIFPFDQTEVYTDWKILTQSSEGIEALVVAINRHKIDHLRSAMAEAGLYPISFEASVTALSKISNLSQSQLAVLIDINSQECSTSLIEKGVPLLTTTNQTGSIEAIDQTLEKNINSLLAYYEQKYQKKPTGVSLIFSGERVDDNLVKTIGQKLQLPATMLTVGQISAGFNQAYAAAYAHIQPPEDEASINLLPEDLRSWYQRHYHLELQKKTAKTQLIAAILAGVISGSSLMYLNVQQKTATAAADQASSLESQATINTSEIVKKANRINTLFPGKQGPQEELAVILTLIPSQIRVENIVFEAQKNMYQVTGVADSRDDLIQFKSSLESSGLFENSAIPIGSLTQQENVNFSIDLTLKKTK